VSKLYSQYLDLKQIDSNKIYIFKSGIFYIALDKDATILSKEFGFKLVNLNENIIKCGFPEKRLSYYISLLENRNINFEIIDPKYNKIDNYSDYLNNSNLKETIDFLLNIDMNEISYKEAFDFLFSISENVKKIYKKKEC